MNGAYLHLAVNHLPIVGVLIGFLVLFVGYIVKKPPIKTTALGIFIFSALTVIAASFTGEGAEQVVENLPGISETLTHKHKEYAKLFFTMMMFLGGASAVTAFIEFKKSQFAKYGFILVLLLSMTSIVISKYVGTSGGEITHIEIRTNADMIKIDN